MNRIKELREELNLSQAQFSNLLGIPVRTIQNWEQEVSTPPEYVLGLIEKRCKGELEDD